MRKKIFTLAIAIMLFSASGMAQGPDRGRQNQSPRIEQMISELGLDNKQAAQFRDIMREMEPNGRGHDNMSPKGNKGKKPEDMDAKKDEIDKKVKKILTKKQYKKYQKLVSKK